MSLDGFFRNFGVRAILVLGFRVGALGFSGEALRMRASIQFHQSLNRSSVPRHIPKPVDTFLKAGPERGQPQSSKSALIPSPSPRALSSPGPNARSAESSRKFRKSQGSPGRGRLLDHRRCRARLKKIRGRPLKLRKTIRP